MAKRYDEKIFSAEVNGVEYRFKCYTTDTRSGFCHTCESWDIDLTDSKESYFNRSWEAFEYATVLNRSIKKISNTELRDALHAILIDGTEAEIKERCEKQFNAFEKAYDGLSDKTKKALAESNVMVNSVEEANMLMVIAKVMDAIAE